VPPTAQRIRVYLILQVILSLAGFGLSALCAAGALVFGLLTSAYPALAQNSGASQFIGLAWVFAILALLAVPPLWLSLRKLFGRADGVSGRARGFAAATTALLAWPVLLLAGAWLAAFRPLGSYLLPPVTALAALIPIWWLIEMTRRNLGSFSPRRSWGALNFALFVSTPTAMVVELLLLVVGAFAAGVFLSMNADTAAQIRQIGQQIIDSNGDVAVLQDMLLPLLTNPWVVLAALSVFSVLVPLLEELFKPLVIWALLGLDARPADGLVLGAVAGAGFGLVETLFNLSNPAVQSQWLMLIVGRTGTNLLHITTTALIGWSLVSAWRSGKFGRLGLAYLAAVSLHGLWNAFSLISGMAETLLPSQPAGQLLAYAGLAGMLGLGVVCLAILFTANRRLRPVSVAPVLPLLEES
jgi:hypothetical protein